MTFPLLIPTDGPVCAICGALRWIMYWMKGGNGLPPFRLCAICHTQPARALNHKQAMEK